MKENVIRKESTNFAVRVIRLYQHLTDKKRELVLSKQLLRSWTSIGANVREAERAQSKKDFISKMNIALKELPRANTGSNYCTKPTISTNQS